MRRDAIREALGTRTEQAESDGLSSTAVKELVEGQQGLRRQDALPLGLAIVIDALLFLSALWSQPGEKFAAFSRMMRDLRGEKERPLALVRARRTYRGTRISISCGPMFLTILTRFTWPCR